MWDACATAPGVPFASAQVRPALTPPYDAVTNVPSRKKAQNFNLIKPKYYYQTKNKKNKKKCYVYNIFHNTFTTNLKQQVITGYY